MKKLPDIFVMDNIDDGELVFPQVKNNEVKL